MAAAINEKPLEVALRLQPMSQGAMAICGFGMRAPALANSEFDPNQNIWQRDGTPA